MVRISKWTFSAFLIVSVLIGLLGSVAAKNLTCYQCNSTNPDCVEKVECKPEELYCAQMVKNGEFIFKGCTTAKDSLYNDNFKDAGVCPTKTWQEWQNAHVFGRSSSSTASTDVQGLAQIILNLQASDSLKMCYCNTDECNTKEQLERSESTSSESGSGNGSATATDSSSGSGNNSGKSSTVSGLMLGSSLAFFLLARRIYGF